MPIKAHRWGLTTVEEVPEVEPYRALLESLNAELSVSLTGLSVDMEKVRVDPNLTGRERDARATDLLREAQARIAAVEKRKGEGLSPPVVP